MGYGFGQITQIMATDGPKLTDELPLSSASRTRRTSQLRFAYQPIVNIHSGRVLGYEALLRGWQDAGFDSIVHVFDWAYENGRLDSLNAELLVKAVDGLRQATYGPGGIVPKDARLFYNLDNRLFESGGPDLDLDEIRDIEAYIHFELSEKHQMLGGHDPVACIDSLRRRNYRIAIDDFGSGYSGLQLLYHTEPELIKIDRFFIDGIGSDAKKKLFVSNVVNMAHIMGVMVVAEGVETAGEFNVCRDVGCDFVQGYFIQRPTERVAELLPRYEVVPQTAGRDRRRRQSAPELIDRYIENVPTIQFGTPLLDVLKAFRTDGAARFFPVVNSDGEPVDVFRERDFKSYVYSPYGFSLLKNRVYNNDTASFVSRAPVAELHTRIDKILELYALVRDAEGVIITENGRYRGVLSARSLLQIVNERELAKARDQNPLSRLPGNTLIHEFVSNALTTRQSVLALVYFDIDNFKPFNDVYGFRHGNRVILLVADLLRSFESRGSAFVGHIGGDDFFLGTTLESRKALLGDVRGVLDRFAGDVRAFYSQSDLQAGCIVAKDRAGTEMCFPLLTLSASIIIVPQNAGGVDLERLSREISRMKYEAKQAEDGIAVLTVE